MVQDRNPEYFLAIASEKSISKAAERLHISQPYLSQYVIHLEKGIRRPPARPHQVAAGADRSRQGLRQLSRGQLAAL
ncbi:MAG: LysR family transcriptional regulator [Oscillospiraceae bacterium]